MGRVIIKAAYVSGWQRFKEVKEMYSKRGVFWPVTLVLIGSILLLVKLGFLPAAILSYWPVLLIVFGLMGLSNVDGGKRKK